MERQRIQGLPNFGVPPIISGTGKPTDFKFGKYIHTVIPNKNPLKIFEKRERRHIRGLPGFLGAHYYLSKGLQTSILHAHL